MRISGSVFRWLPAGALALVILLVLVFPVLADTGTYRITDYRVTLEPQNNGLVKITVVQDWKVLSGDIPWVTVGLPNDNYSIESSSGAVSRISGANSSGFSGVRLDLDKDYQPGQTFQVQFTVLQGHLLERLTSENKWRINYTPGWYDRASIDHLQINLISPVSYQTYSLVSPMPASVNNNVITWERTNLSPGAKFNDVVESTDGSFLTAAEPSTTSSNKGFGLTFVIIVIVILVIGLLIFWAFHQARKNRDAALKRRIANMEEELAADDQKRREVEEGFEKYVEDKNIQPDQQGRYYDQSYGNYITPAIWAAVLTHQYDQRQNQTGNVTPPSCACACVSCACACACACAGGGAAGCSRKTLHGCKLEKNLERGIPRSKAKLTVKN